MKKILFALLAAVLTLSFAGCTPATKATVNVKVTNKLGLAQNGVSVYMFDASSWNQSASFRTPFYKDKVSVTGEDGIAIFELDRMDLELTDSQTTLYFATFAEDNKTITGQTAVTIKSGETKEATIRL
ncbi:MAG: hypothetical protein J5902_05435 [Paludibacteraceae bacterium]|nr:hypothetical protein [Paludibacteraceae bacterium]